MMSDINWNELYELYYKLYYKLLADYFLLNAALRQVLSIYDGDVTDAEKANAVLHNVSLSLDRDQIERANAALLKARRLLDREQAERASAVVRNAHRLLDREQDELLPFTDWPPEEVSE